MEERENGGNSPPEFKMNPPNLYLAMKLATSSYLPPPQPLSSPPLLLPPTLLLSPSRTASLAAGTTTLPLLKPESPGGRPRPNDDAKDGTPEKQKQHNCKQPLFTPLSPPSPPPTSLSPQPSHPQKVAVVAQTTMTPPKPESPGGRPRSNFDAKDGTLKKQKQCSCKHSRCLKLYCECFASGVYCDGCNCNNCFNNVDNEVARREAVEATLERNPNAFRPKIADSPHGTKVTKEETGEAILGKHNKGCNCKKSGCLKKYCECFQAIASCSESCRCIDCKNFEGSEERQALSGGDHGNNCTYVKQATNAAITGATFGPSSIRKRKGQELLFGSSSKDPSVPRGGYFHLGNHIRPSGPSAVHPSALKLMYRSLLADIIQAQDVKELCSVLVVLSEEAAKTIAESRNANIKCSEDGIENANTSSSHGLLQSQSDIKAAPRNFSGGNEMDKIVSDDSNIDGNDIMRSRPMSPLTLSLRCEEEEEDIMFMTCDSPDGLANHLQVSPQLPSQSKIDSEMYAEQEKIVLTKFRDSLSRLITYGELKETKCSSLARSDSISHQGFGNGTAILRTDGFNQQEPLYSGAAKPVVPASNRTPPTIAATFTAAPINIIDPRNSAPTQKDDFYPTVNCL